MLRSFQFQLAALLVALVLLPTLVVGYISYRNTRDLIRRHAVEKVGEVAGDKKELLVFRLRRQGERAGEFLRTLENRCVHGGSLDHACGRTLLDPFMKVEGIAEAEVRIGKNRPLRIGGSGQDLANHPPFRAGQIAQFPQYSAGNPLYLMDVSGTAPGSRLVVGFPVRIIQDLFENPPELGRSGESFLADSSGYFLTAPKYHGHSGGISHPISVLPMKNCLSGKDGEILAPDYRSVPVIHGYRFLPEIGGGCIMAHIQQDEAFLPLDRFWRHILKVASLLSAIALLLALGVSHFFSKTFTIPLHNLVNRMLQARAGDLASPVPLEGPAEFRILGQGFAQMVEAQRRNLEARDEFVSIVSHDLRNPLNAIGIRLSMLERKVKDLPEEPGSSILEQVTQIQLTAHRMQELIDSLLDLTNIQSGQFRISRKHQDCRFLLTESVELFLPLLEKKRIHLHVDEPPQTLPAEIDRQRILQVLANLLSNALRFTPAGGEIRLELLQEPAAGGRPDCLRFGVLDSGPGIPSEQLGRIFDRFYQGKSTGPGCGLGLFIAKEIVAAHGGTIWAESGEKQGARIFFRIPLTPP